MDKVIKHYGTLTFSGRYPWGSGDQPYQRLGYTFLGYVSSLKKEGMSEKEIAKGLGMKVEELRNRKSMYKDQQRAADTAKVLRLKDKGYSNVAIGKKMGINESSVRALLDPVLKERAAITQNIANVLKSAVDEKGHIDVGLGVETHLGISRTKLKTAILMLKDQGYIVSYVKTPQLGTDKYTSVMVLSRPGTEYKELYNNRDKIKLITDTYFEDGGRSILGIETPKSVNSSRIEVKYGKEGGDKDGIIELRRGVQDIALGHAKYAQVRISVDGTHYIKGMAMYSDDLPDGIDIRFNTNKSEGLTKLDVLKPLKENTGNPFGAVVRQHYYTDNDGNKVLSPINIVNEEGDWRNWEKKLSSQVVSKQSPAFAKKQLDKSYILRKNEFDEITGLTNPAVKQILLTPFADSADSDAVHLQAAGFPRQAWAVILPLTDIKENQIYAPNHNNGESVVLIRYPHGGIFEIPELIVNNKHPSGKRLLAQATDAIGIHPKVAERLSGADFDGDTVLVIPSKGKNIKMSGPLQGLKDFDHKLMYKKYEGMPTLSEQGKQLLMGDISNLITDMTILGATPEEISRAVRHSMVVIDAKEHKLNYQQSKIDNGIPSLKEKYQGRKDAGAATLISKASSEKRVDQRKDRFKIDPETGKKIYEETGEAYVNKQGKLIKKTTKTTKMAEEEDAFNLSSGTAIENVYAVHANKLKALANAARKEITRIVPLVYSPSARVVYKEQVNSLLAKLNVAVRNKPLERQATLLANKNVEAEKKANPGLTSADLKKIKGQAIQEARIRIGAKKEKIEITNKEWKAIQAGAISHTSLLKILQNADLDIVKALATPRKESISVSTAKMIRARTMLNAGYTQAEVAEALGVSLTTIQEALNS